MGLIVDTELNKFGFFTGNNIGLGVRQLIVSLKDGTVSFGEQQVENMDIEINNDLIISSDSLLLTSGRLYINGTPAINGSITVSGVTLVFQLGLLVDIQ